MSVVLVNDEYVLLPNQAEVTELPSLARRWRTVSGKALSGAEERLALRGKVWSELVFRIDAWSQAERARMEERIREALKLGRACAPLWGRGDRLASAVLAGENVLTLVSGHRTWAVGDYLFIQSGAPDPLDDYQLVVVAGVEDDTLTVDAEMAIDYPAGTFVRPLIAGKAMIENFKPLSDRHAEVQVRIVSQGETVTGTPAPVRVCPLDDIVQDFEDETLELGLIVDLDYGCGWSSAAVVLGSSASAAEETFESYDAGAITELGGAIGFSSEAITTP